MRLSGLKIQAMIDAATKALIEPREMYCVVRAQPAKMARGMPTCNRKYFTLVRDIATRIPALVATPLPPLKLENSG